MTTSTTIYRGIECGIVWDDSPDGYEDVYISFGQYDFNDPSATTDSFGINDDSVFFYFGDEEVQALIKSITEHRDKFSVGAGWWIDLTDGYELILAEGGDQ